MSSILKSAFASKKSNKLHKKLDTEKYSTETTNIMQFDNLDKLKTYDGIMVRCAIQTLDMESPNKPLNDINGCQLLHWNQKSLRKLNLNKTLPKHEPPMPSTSVKYIPPIKISKGKIYGRNSGRFISKKSDKIKKAKVNELVEKVNAIPEWIPMVQDKLKMVKISQMFGRKLIDESLNIPSISHSCNENDDENICLPEHLRMSDVQPPYDIDQSPYINPPPITSYCGNASCNFGCICLSLKSKNETFKRSLHCRKIGCMFNCTCNFMPDNFADKLQNMNSLNTTLQHNLRRPKRYLVTSSKKEILPKNSTANIALEVKMNEITKNKNILSEKNILNAGSQPDIGGKKERKKKKVPTATLR